VLSYKIYTLPPSVVEIHLKVTKLGCFNRDTPISQHSERCHLW